MRIGEVAKCLGVSEATLRRLERRGLIVTQRDWVGHRRFTEEDLAKIRKLLYRDGEKQRPDVPPDGRLGKSTNNSLTF